MSGLGKKGWCVGDSKMEGMQEWVLYGGLREGRGAFEAKLNSMRSHAHPAFICFLVPLF